jgi:glycosyltransferase involved in cell wall biosynthesis
MAREPRYRWLGSVPHARALAWLAKSHLLVVSSRMEGGANVIAEAARIGTPVLASRVSGNVGMLGRNYPGYFALGDERALARLILRMRSDAGYALLLRRALRARRKLFAPAAERAALLRALAPLLRPRAR